MLCKYSARRLEVLIAGRPRSAPVICQRTATAQRKHRLHLGRSHRAVRQRDNPAAAHIKHVVKSRLSIPLRLTRDAYEGCYGGQPWAATPRDIHGLATNAWDLSRHGIKSHRRSWITFHFRWRGAPLGAAGHVGPRVSTMWGAMQLHAGLARNCVRAATS